MQVNGATAAAGASAQQGGATAAAKGSPLSSDFETFLRMLTTQMQNQDPLSPMESSDFAVQLATFSGVEQQVRTNQLLESLAGGLGLTGLGQYSAWVGMEARTEAPVAFSGQTVSLAVPAAQDADRAELVVTDARGVEVARESLPVDGGPFEWAGTDASGAPLPSGTYQFRLEAFAGDKSLGTAPVAAYARVTEVRVETGGAVAILEGGIDVPVSDITALRAPRG